MKHVDIRHVVVFAALVVGSSAHAATYDYTAHYDYIRKPSLTNAQVDARIQVDTATCDSAVGVQRATPSANYRSCMPRHGWKYSFVTRARIQSTRAPADPYFSTNARVAPGHFIDHDNGMDCQNYGRRRGLRSAERDRALFRFRTRICPARAPARRRSARIFKSTIAFSGEVGTGSREENASNKRVEPPFRFNRDGKDF